MTISIRSATRADLPLIAQLIRDLAEYEKLAHEVRFDEAVLGEKLFGARPYAEVVIGELDGAAQGFALFFHNFSTFLTRKGLYLEDLYVKQAQRGKGFGKQMLVALARIARERECGRFEWSVLDWNAPAIAFYESVGADVMPEWRICRVAGDALTALADGNA